MTGPAASLFEKEYYQLMKFALKPDGLLCSQGLPSASLNNAYYFVFLCDLVIAFCTRRMPLARCCFYQQYDEVLQPVVPRCSICIH